MDQIDILSVEGVITNRLPIFAARFKWNSYIDEDVYRMIHEG